MIVARRSGGADRAKRSRSAAMICASVSTSTAEKGSSSTSRPGRRARRAARSARQGDPLALPARDPHAQLANLVLQPLREGARRSAPKRDQVDAPDRQRSCASVTGRHDAGRGEEHVLAHRDPAKRNGSCGRKPTRAARSAAGISSERAAVEQHLAGVAGQQADQHLGQRALARPDRAGHRHQRPAGDVQ